MILDSGTMLAIIIALAGSIVGMCVFWKQNIELTKEVYRLHNELRKSKRL